MSFLHGILRARADIHIANQSMFIGTDWLLRAIDVAGGTARLHPSGFLLGLYSHHHRAHLLDWESDAPLPTYAQPYTIGQLEPNPCVAFADILVTRDPEGPLTIFLLNRRPAETLVVPLDLSALRLGKRNVRQLVVTGDLRTSEPRKHDETLFRVSENMRAHLAEAQPLRVTLPPSSVSLVFVE